MTDAEFKRSIAAARRADPDGKIAASRIRAHRKARYQRWLNSLNFEGLDMRTVVQHGGVSLVRLPQGAVAKYAVLKGARVLWTTDYNNDGDAYEAAQRRSLFPKGGRINLGVAGFVTAPSCQ